MAVTGATLWDGTGTAPIPNAVLVTSGSKVTAVGAAGSVAVPAGARVVEALGQWLTPGLIDMHVHLDEVPAPGEFLRYGVTSVRDVGSRLVTLQKLRARAARGEPMPHLFWYGRNIDQGKPSWEGAVAVDGPVDVPPLIADLRDRQGVDGVKLYVRAQSEVARVVIAEAHRRNLPVTGHLEDLCPSDAAALGIDNLEHVFTLFGAELTPAAARKSAAGTRKQYVGVDKVDLNSPDARRLIDTLARHQVAVTPTLAVSVMPPRGEKAAEAVYAGWAKLTPVWRADWKRPYWDFISPKGWAPADFAQAERAVERFRRLIGLLDKAGVPIVAGTDTPAPWVLPGAGLIYELEMLVGCGLSTENALRGATGRAAVVLRKTGEVGTLVPGARADFLLLAGDPRADIRRLRRPVKVFQAGRDVSRND